MWKQALSSKEIFFAVGLGVARLISLCSQKEKER